MKKIFTIVSVGLLALTIFGCSKKTSKNTTKENTTVTTKTNQTSDSTSKTTNKTTKKTTTEKQTTIDKKEFKEVSYAEFTQKVNGLTFNNKYKKAIANGTYEKAPDIYDTFEDRVYMLNQENKFVNSGSEKMTIDMYITDKILQNIPSQDGFTFLLNGDNEFKIHVENTDNATTELTFNSDGYIVSAKKIIANEKIGFDFTINWYENDTLYGYSLITKAEADEIASAYTPETYKYMGAIFTGTLEDNNSHTTYTAENEPLHYITSGNYYAPYDTTLPYEPYSSFNGLTTKYTFYGTNNFFYKNDNNELALVTYRISEDQKLYVERTIEFNDCGYAKKVKDEIIEDYSSTSTFYLENYNVEYFEGEPTITVTLFSGLGLFSNGEAEKTITGTPGKKLSEFTGYETPTLTNGSYWTIGESEWFDAYSNYKYADAEPIYKNASFIYGFIDSDYTSVPVVSVSFKAKEEGTSSSIVIGIEYFDDKVQGLVYSGSTSIFYSTSKYITITSDSGGSFIFWGAIKSISFANEEGLFMSGNNRVTSISAIRGLQFNDYCCANMTGLEDVSQGTYDRPAYNIGDYAFYNCSNLTQASFQYAPKRVGKYAFANSGLKYILQGNLFKADFIDECAFDNLADATLILVPIDLKYDEAKDEYNIDLDSLNYLFYNSNWNGLNNDTITPYKLCISSDYLDGTKIVLSLTDIQNADNLCFNLSSYYKYDISIYLEVDGTGSVTLKKALSDTNLLDVNKSNPSDSLTDYIPDGTYWFVIDMVINSFDDATVIITINCKDID